MSYQKKYELWQIHGGFTAGKKAAFSELENQVEIVKGILRIGDEAQICFNLWKIVEKALKKPGYDNEDAAYDLNMMLICARKIINKHPEALNMIYNPTLKDIESERDVKTIAVKTLIKKLQEIPMDAAVFITDEGGNCLMGFDRIEYINEDIVICPRDGTIVL